MILCFDIGGSRIKAALAEGASLTPLGDTPTPTGDFDAFVAALARHAARPGLRGVALSIAGVVDPQSGRIKVANIPCADGRALAQDLEQALRLPVLVLNDADCFVLAEARHGAGRGHRTVFGVILGTGVGGGLVIDGALVQGAGGYAGEWGHGAVVPAPWNLPCGCGLTGCIDAVCGARGLERLHRTLHGQDAPSTTILADWQKADPRAARTIDLWRDLITPPLALVMNVIGASVVPVGGGLSSVPALVQLLDTSLRRAILRRTDSPLVVPAQCRIEPGLIGAAAAGAEAFGT